MFSNEELEAAKPMLRSFRKVLLTGEYDKCIEFINSQELLKQLSDTYSSPSKPTFCLNEEEADGSHEEKLLKELLLSYSGTGNLSWRKLHDLFKENCKEEAYASMLIYCNRMNKKSNWYELKEFCRENAMWVEAHHAALNSVTAPDVYGVNIKAIKHYIVFAGIYVQELISSEAECKCIDKGKLILDMKEYLRSCEKVSGEKTALLKSIIYELDNEVEKALYTRFDDYQEHREPMKLVKWAHRYDLNDKTEEFLLNEKQAGRGNMEIEGALKVIEYIRQVSSLWDQELKCKTTELLLGGLKLPPSGEEMERISSMIESKGMYDEGCQVFKMFYNLFSGDPQVRRFYSMMLLALERVDAAFEILEDTLSLKNITDRDYILYCKKIMLLAIAYNRPAIAESCLQKYKEICQGEKDSKALEKLFREYERLHMARTERSDSDIKILADLCSCIERDNLKGMIFYLCTSYGKELAGDSNIVRLVRNRTRCWDESYMFDIKKYFLDNFFQAKAGSADYQNIITAASAFYYQFGAILEYMSKGPEPFREKVRNANSTLIGEDYDISTTALIDSIIAGADDADRAAAMILLASVMVYAQFNEKLNQRNLDNKIKLKLRLEMRKMNRDLFFNNSMHHFHYGRELLLQGKLEEAKETFDYVTRTFLRDGDNDRLDTSKLYCHIIDILTNTIANKPIKLTDYTDDSFLMNALYNILARNEYKEYTARLIEANKAETTISHIINAFIAAQAGDDEVTLEELQNINEFTNLYNTCNSIIISKRELKKKAEEAQYKENGSMDANEGVHGVVSEYCQKYDQLLSVLQDKKQFVTETIKTTPLVLEKLSKINLDENNLRQLYDKYKKTIIENQGTVGPDKVQKRKEACLKAAKASLGLCEYNEFFLYTLMYCSDELDYEPGSYENNKAAYEYLTKLSCETMLLGNIAIRFGLNGGDIKKILMRAYGKFFESIVRGIDFGTLMDRLVYIEEMSGIINYFSLYSFLEISRSETREENHLAILDYLQKIVLTAREYYSENDMGVKMNLLKKDISMLLSGMDNFNRRNILTPKDSISGFISQLKALFIKEESILRSMPNIKLKLLNKTWDGDCLVEQECFNLSETFHFMLINEGYKRVDNFRIVFQMLRKDGSIAEQFVYGTGTEEDKKERTLHVTDEPGEPAAVGEKEEIPLGFTYDFDETGSYKLSALISYDGCEPTEVYEREITVKSYKKQYVYIEESKCYPTSPVEKSEAFFGRTEIIRTLLAGLRNENGKVTFIIYGLRRVGKTSLLYHMADLLKDDFYSAMCDFEDAQSTKDTGGLIYNMLVRPICRALNADKEHKVNINMPSKEEFLMDPLDEFKNFLEYVEDNLGDKKLMLLIDEFESVIDGVMEGKYSKELFAIIRKKMNERNCKIRIMIAGGGYLVDKIGKGSLKIADSAKEQKIGFFRKEEAEEMILKPFEGVVFYLPEALERVLMITDRHPYYIMNLCNKIIEILNTEMRNIVYPDDVENASKNILISSDNIYNNFWGMLDTPYKELVISAAAECLDYYGDYTDFNCIIEKIEQLYIDGELEGGANKNMVKAAISQMAHIGILDYHEKNNELFRISVEQWRRWARKEKRLDIVAMDIRTGKNEGDI